MDTQPSTRRVDALINHYGSSHQHPHNEAIHFVAIPAIMFSLCGLIYSIHPWALYAFLGASLVYYARLSLVFTAIMLVWSAGIVFGVRALGANVLAVSVVVFVVAWIIQFIGHKIEGKKPSFFEDLQYLWVGPIFLLSRVMSRLGLRW
jgi:uncharacterized membrane protein YGL010W